MKFIADVMLGRLAKRMRLLGFDVLYDPAFSDNDVIRLGLEEGRIILTRDTGLCSRPLAKNHLFIGSDSPGDQIRQVLEAFRLADAPGILTRCSVCNGPLTVISKQDAKDLVPDYVYDRYEGFSSCGTCGRVYWKGSHVRRMRLPFRRGK
jgi:hypothetical protein